MFKDAIHDWCEELNDDLRARTVLAVLQYTHTLIAVMQCHVMNCRQLSIPPIHMSCSSCTYLGEEVADLLGGSVLLQQRCQCHDDLLVSYLPNDVIVLHKHAHVSTCTRTQKSISK